MDSKFEKAIEELNKARTEKGLERGGKLYSMVKDRVEVFRKMWGSELGIHTHIDYDRGFENGSVIVAEAHITSATGQILASGHAMEFIGSDQVTTTAPIESCETAAIGRALACFGLHGGEYASDVEMAAIPRKQEITSEQRQFHEPVQNVSRETQVSNPVFSGHYVPDTELDLVWNQPHPEVDNVLNILGSINDRRTLTLYWKELKEFRNMLVKQAPERGSELKAAFHTQFDNVGE